MTDRALPFGPAFGFGVYIHWPYCARICPYCDFNVYAAKTRDTEPLLEALLSDLNRQARVLATHPPLTSIFLGGGTPSLMSPHQMEQLIKACETAFGLAQDCEITLESNPNNVTAEAARDWKSAGINRLSIGLQSLDDQALSFLGRDHNSADARMAADLAHRFFPSFSLDMIYARPGQSLADWERELAAALVLEAPHLSLYELTIAPGTAFSKQVERGSLTPLPDELQAQMYELTDALTTRAGLKAYEVSNHARNPSDHSRHNMIYWRSGDWLGLGPGAHGRLTINGERIATEAVAKPEAYIKAVNEAGTGLATREHLSTQDTAHELLTMGLRPSEGIACSRLETLLENPLSETVSEHLRRGGWLIPARDTLALTPAGRLLADRIALELLS